MNDHSVRSLEKMSILCRQRIPHQIIFNVQREYGDNKIIIYCSALKSYRSKNNKHAHWNQLHQRFMMQVCDSFTSYKISLIHKTTHGSVHIKRHMEFYLAFVDSKKMCIVIICLVDILLKILTLRQ